jgi:hypothetical protein
MGSVMDPTRARGGSESELGENVFWGALHFSLIASPVRRLTVSFDGGGYTGRLSSCGRWVGLSLGDPYRKGGNRLSGVPCTSVNSVTVDLR